MDIIDIISFITSQATKADLDQIHASVKLRDQVLAQIQAAAATQETEVVLEELSPKYLNGLSGVIVERSGAMVAIQLDESSTNTLKWSGSKRFFVPPDSTSHTLEGIPAQCARVKS
jgi:hypothetical protein